MLEGYRNYFVERRVNLLLKILKIFIVVIGTMGIIRFLDDDYVQAFADFLLLFFLILGYFKLKNDFRQYIYVSREIFVLTVIIAVFVLIHQPDNPIRFIWLSTVVYIVFYLFEKEEALYWIGFIVVVLSVFYLYNPDNFHIGIMHFLTWIMNMLVILMIAHWYASSEEESTKKLLSLKENLAAEVREKTKALEEKTHELQSLNQNLEARIQAKIEESREKDKMLFRQARYAQMGEMISMIAHQWRQPLNTISVTTATLQMYMEMDRYEKDAFEKKIGTISDSVRHLSETIDDFRNFFKLDKEMKEVTFSEIIRSALGLVQASMERKNIEVKTEYMCGCTVLSYPNEIIHVVLNLLKNAEDALLSQEIASAKVFIRVYSADHQPCLEIEDNAGGIAPEIMDKIFDPYFTTKEKSDGTGLGLYMSKIIIEDHCHGKIEVENGAEGACFRILLPPYDKGVSCS